MESKQASQRLEIIRKPSWFLAGVLAFALTVGGVPVGAGDQAGVDQHWPLAYLETEETTCTSDSTWEAPPVPGRLGEAY
jgi:hypothetical protein